MRRFPLILAAFFVAAAALRAEQFDLAWVQKRIQALQPKPAEKRFDEIAWAHDIFEAVRVAHDTHRAVFYFTHDGRMAEGRC